METSEEAGCGGIWQSGGVVELKNAIAKEFWAMQSV
jgi:hypothetical protein